MQLTRIFTSEKYKGTRNYINTQKKYEIFRTLLYFAISISLFISGWIVTKSRMNLLTIVAILGCLPASKSAVSAIMYLRCRSCSDEAADTILSHSKDISGLFDMIFTSYSQNFSVAHITVRGNTICGFTEDHKFNEQAFQKHIDGILRTDRFKDTSVKIFMDLKKYTDRLDQLKSLEADPELTAGIENTLKSVVL